MGLVPSKTEFFLPASLAESVRPCHPDRCWCRLQHYRRSEMKWVYTERGGDGREKYADAVDLMRDFVAGGARGMPGGVVPGEAAMGPAGLWRPAKDWTVRDYERLGEVLSEFYAREGGRRDGAAAAAAAAAGGGGWPSHGPGTSGGYYDGSGTRRRQRCPSWTEFERMQEGVEEKMRRMAEEYQKHMQDRDALLFGSEDDVRKERFKSNMLRTMQELLPQIAQMATGGGGRGGFGGGPAQGTMGFGGLGNAYPTGNGMAWGPTPDSGAWHPPAAGFGGMGNPWASAGLGGPSGMNMSIDPVAAAMAQGMANQAPMGVDPTQQPYANASGIPMNNSRFRGPNMGNAWAHSRPSYRKRRLHDGDPFATPDFGMHNGFRGMGGRNPWDHGDDMLGGAGYEPGPDTPGGPRPRRPPPDHPYPDQGGGGATLFDDRPPYPRSKHSYAYGEDFPTHRQSTQHYRDPLLPTTQHHRPLSPLSPNVHLPRDTTPPTPFPPEPLMSGGRGHRSPSPRASADRLDYLDFDDYPTVTLGAYPSDPNTPGPRFKDSYVSSPAPPKPTTKIPTSPRVGFQPDTRETQSRKPEANQGELPMRLRPQRREL